MGGWGDGRGKGGGGGGQHEMLALFFGGHNVSCSTHMYVCNNLCVSLPCILLVADCMMDKRTEILTCERHPFQAPSVSVLF
jgi:hypothetical protein